MRKRRDRRRGERPVSAKDLAEMGFCEKRVLLAHLHGQRLTVEQRHSVECGRQAHERYYREGMAAASATGSDSQCFVATHLYGEAAWETEALRRYRDEVLSGRGWGRCIVVAYYAIAPVVCRLLSWLPWLRSPARVVVGRVVRIARRRLGERA